jgi:ketosteroid isomerase-like protein
MACATTSSQSRISQNELVLKTQALFDAVAPGDKAPWQSTLAEDAMYTDELGKSMTKKELLDSMHPLPKGYTGTIKVVNGKSHIEGNVAIFSYDMDESETIFGQALTARYHATDIWMYREGSWQIAAGQMVRYHEDPAGP